MKNIAVITVARSDYSILRPILSEIEESDELNLVLYVTGMHLSSEYGLTDGEITDDGFSIAKRIEILDKSNSPTGIAKSISNGVLKFSKIYSQSQPDFLLVMGDRFEMYAATIAAIPFNIPIAHIHGGEVSFGAFDDVIRHSITKLSHLHFVSTEEYYKRVIQLGEEPWRVTISGAPALDNLNNFSLLTINDLSKKYALDLDEPPIVVTFHPTTREFKNTQDDAIALLDALKMTGKNIIFTYPNADTSSKIIIDLINNFCSNYNKSKAIRSLGPLGYYSLLNHAAMMVGNSSSGIIEAASFKLPVVNIGNRQKGRACGKNVIHSSNNKDDILNAINTASSLEFRKSIKDICNIYSQKNSAKRIINKIIQARIDNNFISKKFHDINYTV
tara:strand:+ start:16 stop:1179 length:1164 start_codon:yes stop_codon:yes gene_type:complete